MKLDLNYLKKLIKILDTSNISEFEIQEEGSRLRLSKPKNKIIASSQPYDTSFFNTLPPVKNTNTGSEEETRLHEMPQTEVTKSSKLIEVNSPMVGTFYRSPSPDADPYVSVGKTVSEGSILCIIEAMKLMNEIESEVTGKIVKILVENAQPVEYNQPLFLIEKE
ncbi:MAG TPA: acetyl-CoA carboxylase biotin carboxyl carrier protein [Ignavibacteria bacterium]|nr:acetyl-CoA carboxylase biotin carboxyl carrier protein [Bacteroidota bacterium]HRI85051.1 acetyl-CoA carboxylase biotin carboxyl carrier protein [Ignavibacteria bacterium]HRJ99740.1 acetyl-CoA carboxylase biotin carboxyl carrier protein [Ignavibacteria bacterium]